MPDRQKPVIFVVVYLAIAVGSISAQNSQPRIDAAAERLAKAHIFAIGGVGFAGRTSEEEKDFRVILADARAPDIFSTLYERGDNEAKAYALLGLNFVRPGRFQEIYASLPSSNEQLSVMRGCIMSKEKLSAIAKGIQAGGFSLQASRQ